MTELQGQTVNERSMYWDNIKGILISLVTLGHFLWDYWGLGLAGYLVSFIYLFHMPAFIFVSGFFSKSDHARSMPSIFKLGIIYIIFNTAIMIFSFALLNTSFQLITPSYSYWFLISLIIWRLTIKYIERIKNILLISIIFAIFVGFWRDITNVIAISRTIVFFPFFIMGYKLSTKKSYNFINNRKLINYFKGILLLIYTICLSILFIYKFNGLSETNFLMESYGTMLDLFARIAIFSISALMIMSMVILTPKKPLPLLCKWGKNSLVIYILHRFITLAFFNVFPADNYNEFYIIFAFLASVITLLALGSDMVSHIFNRVINRITDAFLFRENNQREYRRNKFGKISVVLLIICCLSLPILAKIIASTKALPVMKNRSTNDIYEVMSNEQRAAIKDALSIAFVGDLILLQDQVKKAYSDSSGIYDFSPMFEYAKKYLTEADLVIGIFEGPTAGEEAGYSTSNFDDGLPL